jgi:preprotein translocase subunit SecA
MSELALPAPTALAPYAERALPRPSWLDATAERLASPFARRLRTRTVRDAGVIAKVKAERETLAGATLDALRSAADALRLAGRRHGLTEAVAVRAFALASVAAERTLGLRPHDVQIRGGWILLHGMVAEMETGEGKTLTATLPAAAAALAGAAVHIVTVNDYLAARDAEAMAPLYRALGLTVAAAVHGQDPEARRAAYACDIAYCTNKELVFDYLRDRLALGERAQAPARRRIERVGGADDERGVLLRGLCYAIVDEADSVLVDEARTPLVIAGRDPAGSELETYRAALAAARRLQHGPDFEVDARERAVRLTPVGRAKLQTISAELPAALQGPRWREAFVAQAITAMYLHKRDQHYIVRDDKVQIVDEYTGRVLPDRAWEQGLHQMIEVKEGCALTGRQSCVARITYPRFFRRYLRLAGMTGTASEVAWELWSVYRLPVVRVPTHRPVRRADWGLTLCADAAAKADAIADRVRALHAEGRPVLIGTRSVAASEAVSAALAARGLDHELLNARQDRAEAAVVARAGAAGRITVATNMAGRGTDIRIDAEVAVRGGMHVIATELHDARRIDRQLFGRCGRQGDPGSYEAIVACDDELVRAFGDAPRALLLGLARRLRSSALAARTLRSVQARAERHHASVRRELLQSDDRLTDVLAFAGKGE